MHTNETAESLQTIAKFLLVSLPWNLPCILLLPIVSPGQIFDNPRCVHKTSLVQDPPCHEDLAGTKGQRRLQLDILEAVMQSEMLCTILAV